MTSNDTFLKAAELWVPSADGWLLELVAGAFGTARSFGAMSRDMVFGRSEGLPGRSWDEGQPLLLRGFEGSYFQRTAAAHAAGLTSAVAVPYFTGDTLQAVLVLFCGVATEGAGSIELWHGGSGQGDPPTLVDGAYGRGADPSSGSRLAGLALQSEDVCVVEGPGDGGAALSMQTDLTRGLAFPAGTFHDSDYVVSFATTARLPLARRVERWTTNGTGTGLHCTYAYGEGAGDASPTASATTGPIATAWQSGIPSIDEQPVPAAGAGAPGVLAIPLKRDGVVVEVLALHL